MDPLGEEMAKLMPKAQCQVLSDAGHLPWLDQPEECNRLVAKFLKEAVTEGVASQQRLPPNEALHLTGI
jgi:hypothetical protein